MLQQVKPITAKVPASPALLRFAPGEVIGAVEFPCGPAGDEEHWVPCGCGIGALADGPYAEFASVPGACRICDGAGWMFSYARPSGSATGRPYVIAAPGLFD